MERLENSIDARIRRAAQRYVGSAIFAETPTGARLRVNALSTDGEIETREIGLDNFFTRRRVFIVSEPEWRRIVAFVGDETFQNGGKIVEVKNGIERKYRPDVPQVQNSVAAGLARRITATQIEGDS